MRDFYMHAYFDSPETIRNKVREFKTATFNGLNKQDVMNYLSQLSEQQGVMIRLLRENNIPLFVDDGYSQEEQFEKPIDDHQDYLSQYLGGNNADIISEMQAEIETLRAENNELKMSSNNSQVSYSSNTSNAEATDFDVKFGLINSSTDETTQLKSLLEEKDMYIRELENALNESSSNNEFNLLDTNDESNSLNSIERQAYEEEIENLRNEIEQLKSNEDSVDVFKIDSIDDTEKLKASYEEEKASYEQEIASLKAQLEDALAKENDSAEENSLTSLDDFVEESIADTYSNSSNDLYVEELKSTIDNLNATISDLQSELDTCHELLDEYSDKEVLQNEEISSTSSNNISLNSDEEESEEDLIESLKTTIEVLEIEVSKKDKEKANVEFKLEELNAELAKYTKYTDEEGNLVSIDIASLVSKHDELTALEKELASERESVDRKLEDLKNKEAMIEENKHLISEDYVQNILAKEQEIDRLRKQMDKMLTVAQATADSTEQEATAKANQMLEDAKIEAESIVTEASEKRAQLIDEANATLANANEFKANTEKELDEFREETRRNAEEIIFNAQNKANEVLEEAQLEAQRTQDTALEEINRITTEAENKVAEIDALIKSKEKEIDNLQKYYLKVKNDGLVGVKKLYNQLENIIYSDELS